MVSATEAAGSRRTIGLALYEQTGPRDAFREQKTQDLLKQVRPDVVLLHGHPEQLRESGPEVTAKVRDLLPGCRIWWELGDSGKDSTAEAVLESWVATALSATATGIDRLLLDPGCRWGLPGMLSPVPVPLAIRILLKLSPNAAKAVKELHPPEGLPAHRRFAEQVMTAIRVAIDGSSMRLGLSFVPQTAERRADHGSPFDWPWAELLRGLGPGALLLPRLFWSSLFFSPFPGDLLKRSNAALRKMKEEDLIPAGAEIAACLELHKDCAIQPLVSVSLKHRTTIYWATPGWLDPGLERAVRVDAALARTGLSISEYQKREKERRRYHGSPSGNLDENTISCLLSG